MKCRILAVAVMAASVPMVANAAPDFYGKLNVSLEHLSDYPADDLPSSFDSMEAGDNPLADQWQLESRKSRLGVRGSETLTGQGLDVIYQVELGVDMEDDQGDAISMRNSYLGVQSGSFGRIFAGRYDTIVKQIEGDVDQFNNTAADMEVVSLGQQRIDNTLNWKSNDLQGLTFGVQMAPGEGVAGDGLADTLGVSAQFEQSGLYVAGAFEKFSMEGTTPGTEDEGDILRLVATMDLGGGLQVGGMFEQVSVEPGAVGAEDADGNTLLVSGRVQANDRLAFKGQFGRFDSSDLDTEVMTITLGGDYKLSGQTKAYALISLSDAEAEFAGPPVVEADESGNLIAFGLEHNF